MPFPPPITEYLLPIDDRQFGETRRLPESFAELIGKSEDEISSLLSERMALIRSPGVSKLRDAVMSKYRPYAIASVPEYEPWLLELALKEDSRPWRLFLEAPPNTERLDAQLKPYGFAELEAIREFFQHFPSLSCDPYREEFYSPANWAPFESLDWYGAYDELDSSRVWAEAPVIFRSSTTNRILLRRDGGTAWAVLSLHKIVPLKSSFEEFMDHLASHVSTTVFLDYEFESRYRGRFRRG